MKTNRIVYWIATGLLSLMLLMSSGMYVFKNEVIQEMFISFGYPTYLIYPLAIAKVVAAVVLLSQKNSVIKQWVYPALFFEFVLAFFAHVMIGDGEQVGAIMALVLLIVSYFTGKKVFNTNIELA